MQRMYTHIGLAMCLSAWVNSVDVVTMVTKASIAKVTKVAMVSSVNLA